MKGTHNSITYFSPTNFLGKLIKWTSKCQSKTIEEQYNEGVRYFDIRVKITKKSILKFCHGLVEYEPFYNSNVVQILKKPDIIFRLILEKGDKNRFHIVVNGLLQSGWDKNIHYIVDDKKSWNIIWKNNNINIISTIDNYPHYPADGIIPWPKIHNKKYKNKDIDRQALYKDNSIVLLEDFI